MGIAERRTFSFVASAFAALYQAVTIKDRPHEVINMKYPGELYTPSTRVYQSPEEPDYPFHERTIRVTQCGRLCIGARKINLSAVFAGQTVGIREVADKIGSLSASCNMT